MVNVTADLVKALRARTAAGVIDCKKALLESNGSIDLAIENMRKSGEIKAAKKAGNISAEGIIKTKIQGSFGMMLEVNCQTDFVAKDIAFQELVSKALNVAIEEKITNINELKKRCEEERVALVSKIGENINIRRMAFLEGEVVASYVHGSRIGVLISANGDNEELLKQISMHVAACNPEFIKPDNIPDDILEKEYQIQLEIAMKSGKPKGIAEKMVAGRMKKFTSDLSLVGQPFVIDPLKTVGQVLKEYHTNVTDFIRFEVGEGIKKSKINFANEVLEISNKSINKQF